MLQKSMATSTSKIDQSQETIHGRKIDYAIMTVGNAGQLPQQNIKIYSSPNNNRNNNFIKNEQIIISGKQTSPYFFDDDVVLTSVKPVLQKKTNINQKVKADNSAIVQGSQGKQQKKTPTQTITKAKSPPKQSQKQPKKKKIKIKKQLLSDPPEKKLFQKKKKSSSKHSKTARQDSPSRVRDQKVEKIIQESAYKTQLELRAKKILEMQAQQQRQEQQAALNAINDSIRRKNAARFSRTRGNTIDQLQNRLPWGANEQKLRNMAFRVVEKMYSMKQENIEQNHIQDDKKRRVALGLDFLNSQSESFIQRAIKKSKPTDKPFLQQQYQSVKSNQSNPQLQSKSQLKEKEEIMRYINQKKKVQAQQSLENKVISLLAQQRKIENLSKLNNNVKEIFTKTTHMKRRGSDYNSPQVSSEPILVNKINDQQQLATNGDNYSLLYEEYRNFIQGHMEKQAENIGPKKKELLKEKFQELTLRYQNAVLQNQSANTVLDPLMCQEQKKKDTVIKRQKNFNQDQFILEEEEDLTSSQRENKPQSQHIQQRNYEEDDPSLNELACAVMSKPNKSQLIKNEQQQEQENVDENYQAEEEEELQILNFHYLNEAAKMIQKVWRGYYTRQMLFEEQQEQLKEIEADPNVSPQDQNSQTDDQLQFFNPFRSQQQSDGKLIICSTIRSHQPSEDYIQLQGKSNEQSNIKQYSSVPVQNNFQNSILNHIQEELEKNKQEQIQALIKGAGTNPQVAQIARQVEEINERTQQTILNMVQQLVNNKKQQRYTNSDEKAGGSDKKQSVCERQKSDFSEDDRKCQQQLQREISYEKSFNEARKKLHSQNSNNKINQSYSEQDNSEVRMGSESCDRDESSSQILEDEFQKRLINSQTLQSSISSQSQISAGASLQKKELNDLIHMREQAIQLRYKTQVELYNELMRQDRITQQQFNHQMQKIDKWAHKQSDDLDATRKAIEISFKKAADACTKAHRDIIFSQKVIQKESKNDSTILQSLESNEELKRLQKEFNDQLYQVQIKKAQLFGKVQQPPTPQSNQQTQIKVIDNFEVRDYSRQPYEEITESINTQSIEDMPETHSQQESSQELRPAVMNDFKKDEFGDPERQLEMYQLVQVLTSDVLSTVVDEFVLEVNQVLTRRPDFLTLLNIKQNYTDLSSLQLTVQTSSAYIEEYIDNFLTFVITNYCDQIIINLNTPYGFTPLRRMKLIHGYDDYPQDEQIDSKDSIQNQEIAFVLDENLFLQFEQLRLQQLEDVSQSQYRYAIRELEHIHNKVIFDGCNEALNTFRPFFLNGGIPYPWESLARSSEIQRYSTESLHSIFTKMRQQVLDWSGYFCGFLDVNETDIQQSEGKIEIDIKQLEFTEGSQQSQILKNSQLSADKQKIIEEKGQQLITQQLQQSDNPLTCQVVNPSKILLQQDSEYIQQIREERLYRMLITEIKENEYKWYNFGDDKTEFLMELSDMLFENFVEEISKEMLGIPVEQLEIQ